MANIKGEVEAFTRNFKDFIKPYSCQTHKQCPNFVCIDPNCNERGLICSLCLTISGSHKNHDSIQVSEFLEQTLKAFSKDFKKDEMAELLRRIDQAFSELLKILTDFHQSYNSIIKTYISKKNAFHTEKESTLFTENSLSQLKNCRFKSLPEMNKNLNILIGRMSSKLEIDEKSQVRLLEETQHYFDDLNYQINFVSRETRALQDQLRALLAVKSTSPLVLSREPTFTVPRFYENNEIIFMGQTKLERPHGKGICFFKNSHKIIMGEFHNGQLEGNGELYFANGDCYLGQFRFDKKEGRGVYRWTGKDANLYEGEFKSGKRNGRGTFWWADGSWYEGEFRDGVQCGVGTLFREGGQKEYDGSWINGMFDGKGIQYFENGERYEGSFKQDKFHGEGVFYKDDSVIYGVWKDNELSVVNMVKSSLTEK